MKNLSISSLIFTLLLMMSHQAFSEEIGYGEITNDIYVNDYFNMSIPVPEQWAVQSQAAIKEISDIGKGLIAGDDQNLKAILKEGEKQTVNLFAFFKYEQGSPVDFNPSSSAVAERISHMPGIKRGSDYLFHAKKLMQSGQLEYKFPKEIYEKEISGISFDVMPAEINLGAVTIYQDYFVTRIKDYALFFISTYSSESEKNELDGIMNMLTFSE